MGAHEECEPSHNDGLVMIDFNTLRQLHDIATVLENTKKTMQRPDTRATSFMTELASIQRPEVQAEVTKSIILPKKRCIKCKTEIENGSLCHKCAMENLGNAGVLSDESLKDVYIKEKLINGLRK